MARIRTIKPEFFTSEDICELEPLARLLYVALWCEADREGRLAWKPRTFKLRYFPADSCDIDSLCDALLNAGLVSLYGDGLAYIPKFLAHQHINPRESASNLPDPDASARVTDASLRDSDAQVGREGKDKEQEQKQDQKISAPAAPAAGQSAGKTEKPTSGKITFDAFVAACRESGEKAIPPEHPVFRFAADTGIPVDFIRLAWREFRRQFGSGRKMQAGVKGWRMHFDNCVRRNWFKIWYFADDECRLTTAGVQLQREAESEAEAVA